MQHQRAKHAGFLLALYSVFSVSANDCDSEENAELTYYTLSQDFTISPHGTIFPAGPLDYERPNHLYEFVVMAIDKGEVPRTGTATVRIRMANVNDEEPEFSQHMWVRVWLWSLWTTFNSHISYFSLLPLEMIVLSFQFPVSSKKNHNVTKRF